MSACGETGPWGAVCSQEPGHRYSCHDGSKDTSWQDEWREHVSPEGGGYAGEYDTRTHVCIPREPTPEIIQAMWMAVLTSSAGAYGDAEAAYAALVQAVTE